MTFAHGLPRRSAFMCAAFGCFAACASAQLNIGAVGGYAGGIAREGISGFSSSSLMGSQTYGASASYRFNSGMSVGFRGESVRFGLRESGLDLGSLQLRPVLATIGYQGMPRDGQGFTGHGHFGGGVAFTSFSKGPAITGLERTYGALIVATTKTAPVIEFGGGVDYFLTRNISLTTDFRLLFSNVGTQFTAVGVRSVPVEGIDTFPASNAQVLGGIRFWIR